MDSITTREESVSRSSGDETGRPSVRIEGVTEDGVACIVSEYDLDDVFSTEPVAAGEGRAVEGTSVRVYWMDAPLDEIRDDLHAADLTQPSLTPVVE